MSTAAQAQPARITLYRAMRRIPPFIVTCSFAIVGLVVFLALFGSYVEPYDPYKQDLYDTSAPPSSAHWLGTDELGRDIFSRVIDGTDKALSGPLVIALTGLVAVSIIGILSGYSGGRIDMVIQRCVDFMFALPGLLIAIVIVGVFGGGYWMGVLVLCILNVAGGVRIIRGAALEQRSLPYVEAARTLGVPRWRIMYLHVWRNVSPIVFANTALDYTFALISLAGLAYLGLGAPPGSTEWGRMLAENQPLLFSNPAGVLAPGVAIVLLATAVTLIGDWIYDRFSYGGRTGR